MCDKESTKELTVKLKKLFHVEILELPPTEKFGYTMHCIAGEDHLDLTSMQISSKDKVFLREMLDTWLNKVLPRAETDDAKLMPPTVNPINPNSTFSISGRDCGEEVQDEHQ